MWLSQRIWMCSALCRPHLIPAGGLNGNYTHSCGTTCSYFCLLLTTVCKLYVSWDSSHEFRTNGGLFYNTKLFSKPRIADISRTALKAQSADHWRSCCPLDRLVLRRGWTRIPARLGLVEEHVSDWTSSSMEELSQKRSTRGWWASIESLICCFTNSNCLW